ncbi:hypothetical protein [Geodermatophilus sp. URMC 64]
MLLFESRRAALLERMVAAQELVRGKARGADESAAVVRRLTGWFDKRVSDVLRAVPAFDDSLQVTAENQAEWQEAWADLFDAETLGREAVEDALEVVAGACLRGTSVDAGMGKVADALLARLAGALDLPFDRLVLVATGEHTRKGAWVVYVRYPLDAWSLPIAVHELGHVAVDRLEDSRGERSLRAFAEQVAGKRKPGWLNFSKVQELLADGLATLLLGPAYTAALVWRASPRVRRSVESNHPAWSFRVGLSLDLLESLQRTGEVPQDVVAWLEQAWAAEGGAVDAGAEWVEFLSEVRQELEAAVVPRNRFSVWRAALAAATELEEGRQPVAGDLVALLNAAWLIRMRHDWREEPAAAGRIAAALRGAVA